jgi:hypothetical protein
MIPFLLVIASGGVAAAIVLVRRAQARRVEALGATAARLGWNYRAEVPFDTIPDLDRFELFTQGRRRRLTNVMTSPAGDPRAVLFDYTYVTGGGNSQRTHRQTVFYAVSDSLRLPSFSLRPQHFFHGIAKMFGYQDIDLERRPLFSEMFLLRGEDEPRVRALFNDGIAEFFEADPGVCAAGAGREVLYWRPGRRAGPDAIEELIEEGLELARRLAGPGGIPT